MTEEREEWKGLASEFKTKYLQALEIIARNKYQTLDKDKKSIFKQKKTMILQRKVKPAAQSKKLVKVAAEYNATHHNKSLHFETSGESISLIFNKILKSGEKNKVTRNLEELARDLSKSLKSSSVEIVFIDNEICNLFKITEKT